MKKILLALFIFSLFSSISFAQCDKEITLSALKTEYIDASGNLQNSKDEKTIVEINKTTLTITPGGDNQMNGTIKSNTCDWKVPFKEGKSVIKAILSDDNGNTKNLTITIEGKNGKLSFLGELEEMPDRKIRLVVDKFEEKK